MVNGFEHRRRIIHRCILAGRLADPAGLQVASPSQSNYSRFDWFLFSRHGWEAKVSTKRYEPLVERIWHEASTGGAGVQQMPTTLKATVTRFLNDRTPARGTRDEYFTMLKKWDRWGGGVPIEELGREEVHDSFLIGSLARRLRSEAQIQDAPRTRLVNSCDIHAVAGFEKKVSYLSTPNANRNASQVVGSVRASLASARGTVRQ